MKNIIAIVRVRGDIGINKKIKDTLNFLKLYRKNTCVVIPDSPDYLGMLRKIKDYTTFGELDRDVFVSLLEKRGKITTKQKLTESYLKEKVKKDFKQFADDFYEFKISFKDVPGLKKFFKLHPPIGGFERGGIKKPFSIGGVLGYRGKEINKLISKML